MEQSEHYRRLHESNDNPQLSKVESTILTLLHTHAHLANMIIDVPRLQEDCLASGLSLQEFSHGFVRLLSRRLLVPRGEFAYTLSAAARRY